MESTEETVFMHDYNKLHTLQMEERDAEISSGEGYKEVEGGGGRIGFI